MPKYEQNLWKFLSNAPRNFGLRDRMALAKKLVKEVAEYSEKRLVHRDLKPSNIMLDSDQNIIIVDFGIAKQKLEEKGFIRFVSLILCRLLMKARTS